MSPISRRGSIKGQPFVTEIVVLIPDSTISSLKETFLPLEQAEEQDPVSGFELFLELSLESEGPLQDLRHVLSRNLWGKDGLFQKFAGGGRTLH